MEKFYEQIISLIKLVIQLISYMMTSIITIYIYNLYNQKSCHWENLNILTCYLFYVMEF